MKRLLLLGLLLFAVPFALAQNSGNVLLTDAGVLYRASAEWSHEHPDVKAASASYIVLTVREGDEAPRRLLVPATLSEGSNSEPALAYDNESETLFVFWQYSVNPMASELRFVALDRDGNWSVPNTFETAPYHFRRNLRIALTHVAIDKDAQGNTTKVPELNVHATWWETSAAGESARYAMLTVRGSEVAIHVNDLSDFATTKPKTRDVGVNFNREVLRHPAMFESPSDDSVDIVFGDINTNSFHRVTLSPIGNARVRIPVGVADRDFGPPNFETNSIGRIEAISPHPDRLLFYFENAGVLNYIVYRNDEWSKVFTIKLTDDMTRDLALDAMRRLIGAH